MFCSNKARLSVLEHGGLLKQGPRGFPTAAIFFCLGHGGLLKRRAFLPLAPIIFFFALHPRGGPTSAIIYFFVLKSGKSAQTQLKLI